MHAQELYHNDRGETFVIYSNGAHRGDSASSEHASVGFDREGRLIHASGGKSTPLPIDGVKM